MQISTNSIGNYSTRLQKDVTNAPKLNEISTTEKINQEEKTFFAKMYPEKQTEIMDYHFYQKSGKMSGVSVGSNLDRRG